jgi:hypothetical protein
LLSDFRRPCPCCTHRLHPPIEPPLGPTRQSGRRKKLLPRHHFHDPPPDGCPANRITPTDRGLLMARCAEHGLGYGRDRQRRQFWQPRRVPSLKQVDIDNRHPVKHCPYESDRRHGLLVSRRASAHQLKDHANGTAERGRHYIFARLPFPRFLARACLSSKAQCPAVTGRRDTVASSQGPAGRSSRRELHSGDQPAFFFLPPPPIAARQRELTLLWLLCIQAVSC